VAVVRDLHDDVLLYADGMANVVGFVVQAVSST
jgi:hypothetical protein